MDRLVPKRCCEGDAPRRPRETRAHDGDRAGLHQDRVVVVRRVERLVALGNDASRRVGRRSNRVIAPVGLAERATSEGVGADLARHRAQHPHGATELGGAVPHGDTRDRIGALIIFDVEATRPVARAEYPRVVAERRVVVAVQVREVAIELADQTRRPDAGTAGRRGCGEIESTLPRDARRGSGPHTGYRLARLDQALAARWPHCARG